MGNKVDIAAAGVTGLAQLPQALPLDSHSQIVAASLSTMLGLGFSVWSYFSDKRNKELFDGHEFVQKVSERIHESDDFASFVFDVWQKHNLESSDERRKMLKQFLRKQTDTANNEFENFSRLEFIIQNVNLRALRLLAIIHSDVVQKRRINHNDDADGLLTIEKLIPLVKPVESMHEQDIELFMTELSNLGLLSPMYGRYGGTFYIQTELGFTLLDYIRS